jgi:hypothetical protein
MVCQGADDNTKSGAYFPQLLVLAISAAPSARPAGFPDKLFFMMASDSLQKIFTLHPLTFNQSFTPLS